VYRVDTYNSVADYAYRSTRTGITQVTKLQQILVLPLSKYIHFDTGNVQNSLRAYADVTLDDFIVLKGFRILVGKSGGLFVGMPSKKGKDGKYYD